MTQRYKLIGIDPGDTDFRLGNCLTLRKSPQLANKPAMYTKIRGLSMGWMRADGSVHRLQFFDELHASDIALESVFLDPGERGDAMEAPLLVAALLIAFPDARFGLGLPGGEDSLGTEEHYLAIGTDTVDLQESSSARDFLTRLFDYLRSNSYWVDDDLVQMLALLSALCRDSGRKTPVKVLSLSTSGNHQVDARLFHAYQLVEALLEVRRREPLRRAVARWNDTHAYQLNPDEIDFIKYLRDMSLHFKADHARARLRNSQIALGFDQDKARQEEFRSHGIQRLLREATQAYVLARL